ncbi:MAG: hypothetical protein GF317_17640 [Candidatus Lokiarchaeota archaeon]|nr:hypothetical protein [Candidatus Lokiarchaeota archaeon]
MNRNIHYKVFEVESREVLSLKEVPMCLRRELVQQNYAFFRTLWNLKHMGMNVRDIESLAKELNKELIEKLNKFIDFEKKFNPNCGIIFTLMYVAVATLDEIVCPEVILESRLIPTDLAEGHSVLCYASFSSFATLWNEIFTESIYVRPWWRPDIKYSKFQETISKKIDTIYLQLLIRKAIREGLVK